jgi:hypothetical protein
MEFGHHIFLRILKQANDPSGNGFGAHFSSSIESALLLPVSSSPAFASRQRPAAAA